MCYVWLFWLLVLLFNVLVLGVLLFDVLHLVLQFNVLCLLTVFEFHNRERNRCRCPDVSVTLCACIH